MEDKLSENFGELLKQLNLKIEALKLQRHSIIMQNHAMQAELQSLTKKIKQKDAQFVMSKIECDWLEEKLEKLKPEYESLKSKRDFMVGELRYLEPNVLDSKEIYELLKTKNDHLQSEVSMFESRIRILKDKIKQARMQEGFVTVE